MALIYPILENNHVNKIKKKKDKLFTFAFNLGVNNSEDHESWENSVASNPTNERSAIISTSHNNNNNIDQKPQLSIINENFQTNTDFKNDIKILDDEICEISS